MASHTRLYVPAGRNNPVVLNRSDGKRIRVVSGQGGTYALLTGDSLVFGPGKTGTLGFVESNKSDQLASFKGNHMIVTSEMSYLQGDTHLSALDRSRYLDLARKRRSLQSRQKALSEELKKIKATSTAKRQTLQKQLTDIGQSIDGVTTEMGQCFPWKVRCEQPLSMVLAGKTLITGGHDSVSAFDASNGQKLWSGKAEGDVFGLAVADGRLFVSTNRGVIHCLVAKSLVK